MTLPRQNLARVALMMFAFAFTLLFAMAAHAGEEIIGAPPSGLRAVLLSFLSPANLAGGVVAVLGVLGGFQFFGAKRKTAVALAAYYAFHIVEDVYSNLEPGPTREGFNKAASALKVADDYLKKAGWRGLKPGEVAVVELQLQAIHGVEVVKEKLAVAAAEAVNSPS